MAINSGIWNYVEPANFTPRWVHFDERQVALGYPLVRQGSRGYTSTTVLPTNS